MEPQITRLASTPNVDRLSEWKESARVLVVNALELSMRRSWACRDVPALTPASEAVERIGPRRALDSK